jgi:MSHA biogenesis protein MshE
VVAESHLLAALDRSYRGGDVIAGLAQSELTADIANVEDEIGDLLGLSTAGHRGRAGGALAAARCSRRRCAARLGHPHRAAGARLRIRFRIDGVLHVQTEADAKIAGAGAAPEADERPGHLREAPAAGRPLQRQAQAQQVDVRISTMPTQHGESVVMRLLARTPACCSSTGWALPAERGPAAVPRCHRSGPAACSGDRPDRQRQDHHAVCRAECAEHTERKIITVEDPVEYRLPGLNQVQVHDKIDLSFERVLRAALRQDPDVILVGEMRDQTTAEIGLRAAMTGHLVLSTLHTNDACRRRCACSTWACRATWWRCRCTWCWPSAWCAPCAATAANRMSPTPTTTPGCAQGPELGDRVLTSRPFRHGRGCEAIAPIPATGALRRV